MRDLAADVVEDVGLRDTVSGTSTDPCTDRAEIAKEVAIESGKRATSEGELWGTVVGKERVGVLKESDQHEPVVDPT